MLSSESRLHIYKYIWRIRDYCLDSYYNTFEMIIHLYIHLYNFIYFHINKINLFSPDFKVPRMDMIYDDPLINKKSIETAEEINRS